MSPIRFAARSLAKSPVLTGAAILSLALGIGANAAIFSIFERLLLRPLPVPQPAELVNVRSNGPKSGSISTNVAGGVESVWSYPMFRDLERSEEIGQVFSGLAGHRSFAANLAYEGETVSGSGLYVSGGYFPVLDISPAHGRLLGPADDVDPGAHDVVVLSHGFWTRQLGASPALVGRDLVVNGRPMTVVGIAPEGFRGTSAGYEPDVFVPISMREALTPRWQGFDNRRDYWVYAFGRLAPGVTLEAAQAAANVPFRAIVQEVDLPLQEGATEDFLTRFAAQDLLLDPGTKGQSEVFEDAAAPLILLLCVTGFVLLIACANLANLLLVRAVRRSGEIAVRLSLGARRRQVVGQLVTESLLLGLGGGLLGLLVARGTLRLLISLMPADADLGLDTSLGPMVWVFLAVLAGLTGLVGLFPALAATRQDLTAALKGQAGRGGDSRAGRRLRTGLATFEIALAMALLVSAGLFTHSLLNVSRVDLGIDVERLATFGIRPQLNGYGSEATRALYARLEEELTGLPGVTHAVVSMVPLIAGSNWTSNVTVQGFEAAPDADTNASMNEIGPGYFRTVGIPLLAGREIELRDGETAPKVAVVNEAFARKFGYGRDVVGKRMQVGSGGELDIEIVGLASDAHYSEVKDPPPPIFYTPYRQDEDLGSVYFYVRSAADPKTLLASLRSTVSRLDPNLPVEDLRTMEMQVRENVATDRMLTTLSTGFALLATLLAAIGLYGVVAYSVAQRTREIGLRVALGADRQEIGKMVLKQVAFMTAVGSALGLAAAFGLGRLAQSILFGLEGHDPTVLALSVAALTAVALAAGMVPAMRAARVDPVEALRAE